jgi:hypothetical protein
MQYLPVNQATQEAQTRGSQFKAGLGKKEHETLSEE